MRQRWIGFYISSWKLELWGARRLLSGGWFFFFFSLPNGHSREKHFDCCAETRCKGSKTRDREIRYESVVLV